MANTVISIVLEPAQGSLLFPSPKNKFTRFLAGFCADEKLTRRAAQRLDSAFIKAFRSGEYGSLPEGKKPPLSCTIRISCHPNSSQWARMAIVEYGEGDCDRALEIFNGLSYLCGKRGFKLKGSAQMARAQVLGKNEFFIELGALSDLPTRADAVATGIRWMFQR